MDWLRAKFTEAVAASGKSSKPLYLALLVVVLVAAAAITLASSNAASGTIATPRNSETPISVVEKPELYVHVAGEVKTPGIYKLEVGSRVVDAIFAAGGFLESADQTSLNLARELTDGEQLLALAVGQLQLQGSGNPGLVSLNRSNQAELEELPGVGPALAQRLIDWRSANGGFKAKEDLLSVSGIGQKLFASIKDLVTL